MPKKPSGKVSEKLGDASATPNQPVTIVGGGPKKVLYTLQTVSRMGLVNSAKALNSRNACKACGLGMGGQRGGMTNELGEFPSVCNKSIQAQSTDIQAPIPVKLFKHSLSEFDQLSDHELEHLGRLNTPIYKSVDSNHYRTLSWDEAFEMMAERFAAVPPNNSFFYSSGRSSNEAGFVLQLLARLYGTNNVNNCSYYCHQATGIGLGKVLGTGTATVSLADLGQADLIFVIGANPASNHPRLLHQLKNCRDRGGSVIVINPAKEPGLVRFAIPKSAKSMLSGGTWIASDYLQPKIGSDLALLIGLAKAVIEQGKINEGFIANYTEGFASYKALVESYSWDAVAQACGLDKEAISRVACTYAHSEGTIFTWGMGITHHLNGVANVEAIAALALLRGMIGKPGAGLLPLRGHSNVQGIGTIGVKPVLPEDVFQHMETVLGVNLPREAGMDTLASMTAAHEGRIDAAFFMGGNLYAATPHTAWATTALDRIGFKTFLTTTLNRGHIRGMDNSAALVLPVTARDEEWQPTTQESMFNYVRLSDGGVRRLDNVRPEVFILCEFGKRLLPDGPVNFERFQQHDSIRAAIADSIPGMSKLADIGETKREFTIEGRLLSSPTFNTPNGKATFPLTVITPPARSAEYPFSLASIRSEGQFNSIIYEEHDSYRGTDTRWAVLMNSTDMAEMGIRPKAKVHVKSPYGEMKELTAFPFDLPKGNLMAYYPEANILIGTSHDPRSKTPAFKSVAVTVEVVRHQHK